MGAAGRLLLNAALDEVRGGSEIGLQVRQQKLKELRNKSSRRFGDWAQGFFIVQESEFSLVWAMN